MAITKVTTSYGHDTPDRSSPSGDSQPNQSPTIDDMIRQVKENIAHLKEPQGVEGLLELCHLPVEVAEVGFFARRADSTRFDAHDRALYYVSGVSGKDDQQKIYMTKEQMNLHPSGAVVPRGFTVEHISFYRTLAKL